MNLLQDIADKINSINADSLPNGIKSVLTHIEIAETHLTQGRTGKTPHLYTDVVYRTNHAFEGILKEAYQILEGKSSSEKSPFEIENYLSNNNVFNERVMELFVNYRKNWRNPSTHDHKLFFVEQEAFLAIVTVSAFVNLLLDQITEKISYDTEKAKFDSKAKEIAKTIENYENLQTIEKIGAILMKFAEELRNAIGTTSVKSESQLLGMMSGFLSSIEPSVKFDTEPSYPAGIQILRPTGLIILNNEKVVINVLHEKRDEAYNNFHDTKNVEVDAMKSFLGANNYFNGIVFYLPQTSDDVMVISHTSGEVSNSKQNIREIYADRKSNWAYADYYTSEKTENEPPAEE